MRCKSLVPPTFDSGWVSFLFSPALPTMRRSLRREDFGVAVWNSRICGLYSNCSAMSGGATRRLCRKCSSASASVLPAFVEMNDRIAPLKWKPLPYCDSKNARSFCVQRQFLPMTVDSANWVGLGSESCFGRVVLDSTRSAR